MNISEFAIATARGPLNCALAAPAPGKLAADAALLLAFGGTRQAVLDGDSGFAPALHFVRAGHRALSFDLPNHGDFVDQYGQSIDGICAAFVAGDDPFARFVAHGKAAIDACVEKGLAPPGRIFACGGSRGGYCALRLAAAPGSKSYGRLSIIAGWLCGIEAMFDISPQAFVPPPKVTSTVVALTPRAQPLSPARMEVLERVTAAAFGQRRKMLRSSLKSISDDPAALLIGCGIDPTTRAEKLDITAFCALARAIDGEAIE